MGEQQPFKELEFLRQRLDETEARLSEENAYLRDHISMLHRQLEEIKEDADYFEAELKKMKEERDELSKMLKQQDTQLAHVKFGIANEQSTPPADRTQPELKPAQVVSVEEYKCALDLNAELQKKILQQRLANESIMASFFEKEQDALSHREAIDTLSYNLAAHRKQISELTAFLNEEKLRSERLADCNYELTELNEALRVKYDVQLRQKQRLEFEVDNSEEMKKAVFVDLQKLSRINRQLTIDNEALRNEVKVLANENAELVEASQQQSMNFVKMQQLQTDKHLLRIELEESKGLLELMKQEKNIIQLQAIDEARIKDQIIKELQIKERELLARMRMMQGRITEQDNIINQLANVHKYQGNEQDRELENYRSLTKTLSGENIRLKEELRKVRSGENILPIVRPYQEDEDPPHQINSADDAQENVGNDSVNSQQGSNSYKNQVPPVRLEKQQSSLSLAQKGLMVVDSIRRSTKAINQETQDELVEVAERMAHELEELQRRNHDMRLALAKLSQMVDRQRIKLQSSPTNFTNDDERLFGRVVSELEKEKQANEQLSASINNLSKELLRAQQEIMRKSEKINYLNKAFSSNRQELADGYNNPDVENLKKYLHNSNTSAQKQEQLLDRRSRSNRGGDQNNSGDYKGQLENFAKKVLGNEEEEDCQRSHPAKRLQKKLLAYSTSLVPDLERELEKYKRLYDDAMFALKERDAEAKELQTDFTILKTKYLSLERGLHPQQRFQAAHRMYESVICLPSRPFESDNSTEPVSQLSQGHRHIKLRYRLVYFSEFLKNSSVTYRTLLVLLQRLSETCLKLAHYGSIPILQMDNIYIADFLPSEPEKLKVRLVDVDTSHRALQNLRSKTDKCKYLAPENAKEGSLITLESLVWNIGALLEEMLACKRTESLRDTFDPQLRSTAVVDVEQRKGEDVVYQQLLLEIVKILKVASPSERLSLGRLQYHLQQQLNKPLAALSVVAAPPIPAS